MSEPLFPEPVRNAMRLGTSSRWAADLTADDLPAIIWMIGEFGRRAGHVLAALERQWSASPPRDHVAAARARLALEGLFRVYSGDRPSQAEYIARWWPLAERAYAAAHGRPPELPAEEMGDRWPVLWEARPVGSLRDPRHKEDGCVGLWEPSDSPAAADFAAALAYCPQAPLVVSIGGVRALIERPPSPSGDLSVFWLGPEV
jgi:hypothetical protein